MSLTPVTSLNERFWVHLLQRTRRFGVSHEWHLDLYKS